MFKARWYSILVMILLCYSPAAFGLRPSMTREPVPGMQIVLYADELQPVIVRMRNLADDELRKRIESLRLLIGSGGGEQNREPKIDMFAAYDVLRERGTVTSEEAELVISTVMSEPSIVVGTSVNFAAFRSVDAQLNAEQQTLRDEQLRSLESQPRWKRTAVQAGDIQIGWLYASLDEDHLKPGEVTELTISFVPITSITTTRAGPTYSMSVKLAPGDPRFKVTSRPGEDGVRRIMESGIARSYYWHYSIAIENEFPDKVLLKPQVSLMRLPDKSTTSPKEEELASKELELYLYRKPAETGKTLTLLLTIGTSLISGVLVFGVTNFLTGKKEQKQTIEQLIEELEFDLALVQKPAPETASVLWDPSGRKLTFLPSDMRNTINSVYELVSRAKKNAQSWEKGAIPSVQVSDTESLFGELRAKIPPLLVELRARTLKGR